MWLVVSVHLYLFVPFEFFCKLWILSGGHDLDQRDIRLSGGGLNLNHFSTRCIAFCSKLF